MFHLSKVYEDCFFVGKCNDYGGGSDKTVYSDSEGFAIADRVDAVGQNVRYDEVQ